MTIQQLKSQAVEMKIMESHGQSLVIRPVSRNSDIKDPDFKETGQALCGVLYPEQTLDQFKSDWVKRQFKIYSMYAPKINQKQIKKRK